MVEYSEDTVRGTYDSCEEFFDQLNGKPALPRSKEAADYWRGYAADDWMGLEKVDLKGNESAAVATMRLCREGWTRGAAMLAAKQERMEVPTIKSIQRRGVWSEQGDEVDMQRVWAGDLDRAWRSTRRLPSRGPTKVRIVIDALASGSVDAEEMAMRGASAILLCDALTSAGYAVEMRSAWQGRRDTQYFLSVTVKSFSCPVDIGSLAATIGLPAFFRALGHMWGPMVSKTGKVKREGGYYVQPLDESAYEEAGVLLFSIGQSVRTEMACEEWVRSCVATLGGIDMEQREAA